MVRNRQSKWYFLLLLLLLLALETRAIISLQMGNTPAALQDLNAAIATCPTPFLYTERGVAHQLMGDLSSAVLDYRRALELDHTHQLAH